MYNPADLPFPLNIQALVFSREYGFAPSYLHHGHYNHPGEPADTAQARAISFLLANLPPTGKLLAIESGLGGLTAKLQENGYNVTGITSDEQLFKAMQELHGPSLPVCYASPEHFREGAGEWDALLFHESTQQLSTLALFEQASTLLKPDGEIIILDEFSLTRTAPGLDYLHLKQHVLNQAERFGFSCNMETACNEAIAPALDFLDHAIRKYRPELISTNAATPEQLDLLLQGIRTRREQYLNGQRGHFLLHLKRQQVPKWQVRQITAADQPAVSVLFEQVFGHPLSPQFWQWKYDAGRGDAIGLWQDDQLVAHYGGMVRRFHHKDTVQIASQSCDVMVAPQQRAILSRKGPFFLTCSTYLEQFVGYGRPYLLAYGFPNERAYRLPYKLGLYSEPITRVNSLIWPAAPGRFLLGTRPLDLASSGDRTILNSLWNMMRTDLDSLFAGIRDADYWDSRYCAHPRFSYQLALVYHRLWRTPMAALVLKQEGERMELLDWVGPIRHNAAAIAAARKLTMEAGCSELYLWASEPVAETLAETRPRFEQLNILVPTNAWTSAPPIKGLQGKFWLTGGDTDFH